MFPVAGTVPLQLKRGVAGLPDVGLGRDRRMTEPGGDLFQELEPVASLVSDRGVLDSVLSQSPIERGGRPMSQAELYRPAIHLLWGFSTSCRREVRRPRVKAIGPERSALNSVDRSSSEPPQPPGRR